MEIWKDITGYEGHYVVSNFGKIKTIKPNTSKKGTNILNPEIMKFGYHRVKLTVNNVSKKILVHRIVAMEFLPPDSERHFVNHKDCDTGNNYFENLEWTTHEENMRHSRRLNRFKSTNGENNPSAKLSESQVLEIRKMFSDGVRNVDLHNLFKVSKTQISRIVQNKSFL